MPSSFKVYKAPITSVYAGLMPLWAYDGTRKSCFWARQILLLVRASRINQKREGVTRRYTPFWIDLRRLAVPWLNFGCWRWVLSSVASFLINKDDPDSFSHWQTRRRTRKPNGNFHYLYFLTVLFSFMWMMCGTELNNNDNHHKRSSSLGRRRACLGDWTWRSVP